MGFFPPHRGPPKPRRQTPGPLSRSETHTCPHASSAPSAASPATRSGPTPGRSRSAARSTPTTSAARRRRCAARSARLFAREPALKAALEGKAAAVAALDVCVLPEDDADPEAVRPAKFIDWTVRAAPHGWDGLIRAVVLPALIDGFSVTEKTLRPIGPDDSRAWAGLWGLRHAKTRDTAWLRLRLDAFRNVAGVVSLLRGLEEYDPAKVILFTHADLFDNPFGRSDVRAAYRACNLIEDAYKLWQVLLRMTTGPFLHATVDDAARKPAMEAALAKARGLGYVVSPTDDTVAVLNLASASSFDAFERKVRILREEVYFSIRGAYLPFLQGAGTGGDVRGDAAVSKAAGSDPLEFLLAKAVERVLTNQLVPDLVRPNFAPGVGRPSVGLGGVDWRDTAAQLDVARRLRDDFRVPVSRRWLHKVSQVPPPDGPGDEVG